MKKGLLIVIGLFICIIIAAMEPVTKNVTGTVKDETGVTLPGVSVVIEGTTIGTITDIQGHYSLKVEKGAKVINFSFVGMKTQKITLGSSNVIDVVLKSEAIGLDEVVAVGYGTTRKKDLTGSVSTVKSSSITAKKMTNVSESLQGAVAGVSITRSGSSPGASASIRIRGVTTLEGSNNPLILVDGTPVDNIDIVNSDDIENISILKDGAAAAIYGSRAAAGVVLITTKRGKIGKMKVSYDYNFFINKSTRSPEVVNVTRWMELQNEFNWNDAGNISGDEFNTYPKKVINSWLTNNKTNPDEFPNTDWEGLLMKKQATGQRHTVNIRGGSEKIKTSASFSYENQDALYKYFNWKRATFSIRNDIKISDNAGAIVDVNYKYTKSSRPNVNPTYDSRTMPAYYPALWKDGRLAGGESGTNPYATFTQGGFDNRLDNSLYGRLGVWIRPVKGLKISAYYLPKMYFNKSKVFHKKVPYWDFSDPDNLTDPNYMRGYNKTRLTEGRTDKRNHTNQIIANYNKMLGSHNFSLMAGYEEYASTQEVLSVMGDNYIKQDYPYIDQAPVGEVYGQPATSYVESAYHSVFSRLSYNYANKYYLQANIRADASSKFAKEYRWGYFPSVSAGWVLSKENFMKSLDFISFFKLRGSVGELGNDRLGNYLSIGKINYKDILLSKGNTSVSDVAAAQQTLAIKDIRWEKTTTYDVGADINFLDNKLNVTGDVYKKKTTDMLLNLTVPKLIGYGDPKYNVGSMNTNGWELSVGYHNKFGGFRYGANFNIFDSKSKIKDVRGRRIFSGNTISEEGSYFKEFYGYKTDGLFQTQKEVNNYPTVNKNIKPGDIKFVDVSGPKGVPDGIINAEYDKIRLGSSLPHMQYGGSINLGYKNISLSAAFQGVGKRTVVMSPSMIEPFIENHKNVPKIYNNSYWSLHNTPEQNLKVKYPRLAWKTAKTNYSMSNYWLMNGSYFRLKNVNLTYTLPKSLIEKTGLGIENVKVYFTGNNLFSIDHYPKGWDPEVGGTSYAITKSYLFGLSVNF